MWGAGGRRQPGGTGTLQAIEDRFLGGGIRRWIAGLGTSDRLVACVVVGLELRVQVGVVPGLLVVAQFPVELLQVVVRGDVLIIDFQCPVERLDRFLEKRLPKTSI